MDRPPSPVSPPPASAVGVALRTAILYLAVSTVWIILTDLAVESLVSDPSATRRYQTWKGIVFIVLSAALIFELVRREVGRAHEGEGRLRALIEQSLAGIYLIRDGRFLYVNSALGGIFGYEPSEMVESLEVADVVAEEDRERVLENLRVREEGSAEAMRYRFTGRTRTGEEVRLEVHGRSVAWDGGHAVLGLLLEVGQRERLERQVGEAQRLRSLGELTGQIAHDFNNFLTGIVGPLEIALADLPLGHPVRPDVDQARDTALSAASLSRKLLTFSHNRPSVVRVADLNEVLRGMQPLLVRLLGASVTLRVEPADSPCVVRIDPTDLEQILMNLVLNAGEAVEGMGTVTIRTGRQSHVAGAPGGRGGEEPPDGWVRLEVEDDGVGIEPEALDRLFEPFFTTKETGTGLGLATVYGVTSQVGGLVDVDSTPGEGSRFVVLLPFSSHVVEALPAARATGEVLEGHETILVVEDDETVREVTRRALQRYGYTVHVAADGRTAKLLAAGMERLDLLLTDIQLPDILGPRIAEAVGALHPGVAVVYFSGYSDQEASDRVSRMEGTRLVHKPYVVDDLLTAIRSALDDGAAAAG